MLVQLLQSIAMAALIGGVFFQIGTTQESTAKRLPVLFFCTINQVRSGGSGLPTARLLFLALRQTNARSPFPPAPGAQGIFGALSVINSFPAERILTLRERVAGSYYVSAYFLAKTTSEAALFVVAPVCFASVAYWMVGLQVGGGNAGGWAG